jgi:putative transposase
MISFKGTHFPKDVILYAVFFYVLSITTLSGKPLLLMACLKKAVAASSSRRSKGGLYQNLPINATEIPQLAYACDRTDLTDTLDFMLSERRDEDAATAFFKQAINNNGLPDKVVMDKSGSFFHDLFKVTIRNAIPNGMVRLTL